MVQLLSPPFFSFTVPLRYIICPIFKIFSQQRKIDLDNDGSWKPIGCKYKIIFNFRFRLIDSNTIVYFINHDHFVLNLILDVLVGNHLAIMTKYNLKRHEHFRKRKNFYKFFFIALRTKIIYIIKLFA